MGGTLVHLEKSKAFNWVDHHYFEVVLEAADLGLGFCSCISAIYGDIRSSI